MKKSTYYTVVIVVGVLMIMGVYQQGKLDAGSEVAPAKIAVVDVTKVIQECKKFKTWQEQKQKEAQQIEAEFAVMKSELDSLSANLKIHTPGSEDHRALLKKFIEKRAILQSKDSAYKELWNGEKDLWTEKLYEQLLLVVQDVAKKKGLDLIIANEELDLKDPMRPDIMQTIVTKKLLYRNEKYDITQEVLAALDDVK